ncbi:CsbD family protein [Ktedonobacteria bacterium brp13]|nr:CsbD family protein [Ktedonobacteria bacterium brp13]
MTDEYKEKDLGTQGHEDTLKGKLKQAAGKVQSAVGNATDNPKTEAKGDVKRTQGKAQETLGKGEKKVDHALDS